VVVLSGSGIEQFGTEAPDTVSQRMHDVVGQGR
jgi:hypothetical protein